MTVEQAFPRKPGEFSIFGVPGFFKLFRELLILSTQFVEADRSKNGLFV
jgi:hypothetical protein